MSSRHRWYSDSHTGRSLARSSHANGALRCWFTRIISSISEPEERAFFDFVRRQSVLTACERCERPVRLIPPKALCASCVSALEYGAPASMKEYGSQETLLDSARPS